MKRRDGITLLLTMFDPADNDIKYWSSFSSYINNKEGIEIFILVDNPDLKIDRHFKKTKIFKNDKNKGKFNTVYDFIKKDLIKTKHIKVCDPDDRIKEEILFKSLNDYPNNDIYIMKQIIIRDNKETENEVYSLPNCSTILPVEHILKDKLITKKENVKNWLEDQILGAICYSNGAEISKSKESWYIYNNETGMTSSELNSRDIKEIFLTLDVFWLLLNRANIKPKTSFPGNLGYLKSLIKKNSKLSGEELDLIMERLKGYEW